jgi:Tfp pilus assembly PilM family ATPase
LNVDGLTNLAIAEGTACRFTRVIGGGVETMASELAARRGIALSDARNLLMSVDLSVPGLIEQSAAPIVEPTPEAPPEPTAAAASEQESAHDAPDAAEATEHEGALSLEEHEARERSMGYAETISATAQAAQAAAAAEAPTQDESLQDVRGVLENGIREIAGEVRNSLDFHRTQEQGGEVSHVALSGAALDLPGFADALQSALGMEVRKEVVGLTDASLEGKVSTHRLAVAAGLAAKEAPR